MTEIYKEDINGIIADKNIPWDKLDGKDILITGGTGLLGKLAVHTLIALRRQKSINCQIHVLIRNMEKAKSVFKEEIENNEEIFFIEKDIKKFTEYEKNLDFIIHAASETSSKAFIEKPAEVSETAIFGTTNLLKIAKEKNIKGMIFLSTMEVYGTPDNDEKISEDRELTAKTYDVRNSYPIGKIASESLCVSYANEFGVPVNVLRLTQTFGPGVSYDDGRVFAEFARCTIEDRNIILKTEGKTKRNYLYTADAIRAIFTVMISDRREQENKAGSCEIYNVANENTYCSIKEMAETVITACGDGNTKLEFDLSADTGKLGYAPTLCMNLDTTKIKKLGWKPEFGMEEMYERMIKDMWESR